MHDPLTLESILVPEVSPARLPAALLKHLAPAQSGLRGKLDCISRNHPDLKTQILADADRAMKGMLVLPGTAAKPYFVGDPPKWHENPVRDDEYVCSLNRMFHWLPLLQTHAFTGDQRYAHKVVHELRNWIESCPRPTLEGPFETVRRGFDPIGPWRPLEAGIRMFWTWPHVAAYLAGSPLLSGPVLEAYIRAMHVHGEALACVSPQLWPKADHNHYLMEMLGLLNIAVALPFLRNAPAWRDMATRELERCATAQLTSEGGQIEGCPHYHNGCVRFFAHAMSLGRQANLQWSPEFLRRVRVAMTYSLHAARPTGSNVPWGDSDATLETVDTAILAWECFGDPGPVQIVRKFAGEEPFRRRAVDSIWRISDIAAFERLLAGPLPAPAMPRVFWARDLNQAMLRTSWDRDALSVFFACRSPVNNSHAHIDPGGFDFCALGKPLLVDPGRFCYRQDADRYYYKSAAVHNMLMVNDRDPFEYFSSWSYGPQKDGRIVAVTESPGLLAAISRHENYAPAVHRRLVAIVDERCLLIADEVESVSPGDKVQLYFHIDSPNVAWDDRALCASTSEPDVNVAVYPAPGLKTSLVPSRVSPNLDIQHPSTRLRLEDEGGAAGTRVYATLAVPFRGGQKPTVENLQITRNGSTIIASWMIEGRRCLVSWTGDSVSR